MAAIPAERLNKAANPPPVVVPYCVKEATLADCPEQGLQFRNPSKLRKLRRKKLFTSPYLPFWSPSKCLCSPTEAALARPFRTELVGAVAFVPNARCQIHKSGSEARHRYRFHRAKPACNVGGHHPARNETVSRLQSSNRGRGNVPPGRVGGRQRQRILHPERPVGRRRNQRDLRRFDRARLVEPNCLDA